MRGDAMKMRLILLIFYVSFGSTLAFAEAIKLKDEEHSNIINGDYKEYYPSGALQWERHYRNGKKHGEYKEFYESGNIKTEGSYDSGMLVGTERRFYENGLEAEIHFEMGEPAYLKMYYDSGELLGEVKFKNGKYHGLTKYSYKNGNIKREFHYVDGQKNGEERYYYENGNLQSLANIVNDQYEGKASIYDIQGKLAGEIIYKNGEVVSQKQFE